MVAFNFKRYPSWTIEVVDVRRVIVFDLDLQKCVAENLGVPITTVYKNVAEWWGVSVATLQILEREAIEKGWIKQ